MNNLLSNAANETLYEAVYVVDGMDENSIKSAKEIFRHYKEKGVILNTDFDDVRWQLHDEYSNVGIRFDFPKLGYKRHLEPIFGILFSDFVLYQKTYIVHTLGDRVLSTLQKIANDTKKFIKNYQDAVLDRQFDYKVPYHLIEFLSMLPCIDEEKRDEILFCLEELIEINYEDYTQNRRSLSQFQSYFLFDRLLNQFWTLSLDRNLRLFYFPLYLWWQITGVIPLRPREFLLTPRNCLVQGKDGPQLKLRRNKLKGSGGKVNYTISEDYIEVIYSIPAALHKEIENYLEMTEYNESNNLDTLFRTEYHYQKFGHPKHVNSRYYTYANLSCCLRIFYQEVIADSMHHHVIKGKRSGDCMLGDDDIEYIYLGDTRHIAMINIIAQGGTPTIAMLLAGHSNIDISSHYYANLNSMIECRTYMKYKALLEENSEYILGRNYYSITSTSLDSSYVELEGTGRCYSSLFAISDVSDCKKTVGPNGEIGYCYTCPYYRKNGLSYFVDDVDLYKSKLDKELHLFLQCLEKYRKNVGLQEDVKSAFLRLEASSSQYESYYMQKLLHQWKKGKE